MYYNITHGVFSFDQDAWADKSEDAKDFISRLLTVDPKKRMTAPEAINHRWMMFASKSTMNMNRAVQELERYNIWTKANATGREGEELLGADPRQAAQTGIQVVNYIALADCRRRGAVEVSSSRVYEPYDAAAAPVFPASPDDSGL